MLRERKGHLLSYVEWIRLPSFIRSEIDGRLALDDLTPAEGQAWFESHPG